MSTMLSGVHRAVRLSRLLRLGRCLASEAADAKTASVDKSALMKLRRRTGYGFVHCKRALLLFPADAAAAEQWLHENAQRHGWHRAAQ